MVNTWPPEVDLSEAFKPKKESKSESKTAEKQDTKPAIPFHEGSVPIEKTTLDKDSGKLERQVMNLNPDKLEGIDLEEQASLPAEKPEEQFPQPYARDMSLDIHA